MSSYGSDVGLTVVLFFMLCRVDVRHGVPSCHRIGARLDAFGLSYQKHVGCEGLGNIDVTGESLRPASFDKDTDSIDLRNVDGQ